MDGHLKWDRALYIDDGGFTFYINIVLREREPKAAN
jgi:hypothetical protein